MGRSVFVVLSRPTYALLAIVTSVFAVGLFVLPENWRVVRDVVLFGGGSVTDRVTVLVALYPLGGGTTDPIGETALVVVGGLTGVTAAVFAYRLRVRGEIAGAGSGSVGVTIATLAGGCVACGSVVTAALGVASAGVLAVLPFGGLEFLGLAVASLFVALHTLATQIEV